MGTEKTKPIEVTRGVKINYTDEEIHKKANLMVDAMSEIEAIEAEMKAEVSDYKDRITGKKTEVKALKDAIQQGYEILPKKCILIKNFERQKREFWYEGQMVEEETMTKEDYQMDLDLVEKGNAAEEKRLTEETADVAADSIPETPESELAITGQEDVPVETGDTEQAIIVDIDSKPKKKKK